VTRAASSKRKRARAPKDVPDQLFDDGGDAPAPKPRRGGRKASASAGSGRSPLAALGPRTRAAVAVAATCLVLGFGILSSFAFMPGPGQGRLVEVQWPDAATSAVAADRLVAAGLIRSPLLFRTYLLLAGGVGDVSPGVHLLSDDMSPRTLLRRLKRTPGGATVRVVVPEGYNKFEIAKRLHEAGICSSRALLELSSDRVLLQDFRIGGANAEGYLFPATYDFQRNADPRDVLRRMVLESDRRYARLFDEHASGLAELKSTLGWGKPEVITLASIIEKESAVDEERPLIASVFLNRLRDPGTRQERRKLQSDPTARYGCLLQKLASCESPDGKVTPLMVHDPLNLYSTYAHAGLTPGPIANPGEKSVQAVLAPAQTRYMFFVARGNGRHAFSETFEDHNAAIRGRR
jgi:UPF0755 protein